MQLFKQEKGVRNGALFFFEIDQSKNYMRIFSIFEKVSGNESSQYYCVENNVDL